MEIGSAHKIAHSAQKVFEALRDHQPELVQYLPNVDAMEVLKREENGSKTRLYNRWQGSSQDVSKVIRPFVTAEMLAWFDDATWDEQSLSCDWTLESVRAKDIFACSGTTKLAALSDDSTSFEIRGQLHVHPEKIPGVPVFLARRIRQPLEKFVAGLLEPNLTKIAGAVADYLGNS